MPFGRKVNTIHAIAFVDISFCWGPAIHFVEVWNEYVGLGRSRIVGHAVLEKNEKPYTDLKFTLVATRIRKNTPLRRRIAKIGYDFRLFFRFLLSEATTVYIRQSAFGFFLLIALFLRNHEVFVEMNGLAKEDEINRHGKSGCLRVVFFQFMEWLYMKLPGVSVLSVSEGITETVKKRYGMRRAFTVPNGCSPKLIREHNRPMVRDDSVLNVGFLGTFTPWDGHEKTGEFYEAFKKVGRKVRFHVAGTDVKESIIYKKYSDNQDFLFYDSIPYQELGNFYGKLDAAYDFSRFDRGETVEASTLKVLEYWASKIPIFATDIKGYEFIREHQIGYLVGEDEYSNRERFVAAVREFSESINTYKPNYRKAGEPRTWRDAALDTRPIIEGQGEHQ